MGLLMLLTALGLALGVSAVDPNSDTQSLGTPAAIWAAISLLLALYIGGMGPHRDKGRNFYYELAVRYGFADAASRCQDAYLAGRKDEAAALVPAELLAGTSLIGPEGYVAERLAALKESGVTTLNVTPLAPTHADRVRLIERVRALAA